MFIHIRDLNPDKGLWHVMLIVRLCKKLIGNV